MEDSYTGKERRKFRRIKVDFTVIYQVDKPLTVRVIIGWDKEIEALMLDLSEEGMALLTNYDIPQKSELLMHFTLINLTQGQDKRIRTMRILGQVRYSVPVGANEHRLGIYFVRVTPDDRKAISDLVIRAGFTQRPLSENA
jgi:c-di-GMP-binding flagellar brake protein YcgR